MRNKPTHYYGRRFTIALSLFTACFLLYALINPAYAKTTEGKDLLQFTSGSHVLGFSPGSVRLASGSHMLKVDFIGGNKVAPVSKEGASEGKAQPLTKVTYPNVWDGIDIAYEKGKTSIVKSTYTVSAGKKASSIRLGYNRPLRLDKNGNLVITYDTGRMTESKPLAWQVIEGQKKPVMVAYNLYSDHELGFTVGDYDKSVPLVIDPDITWSTFVGNYGDDYGSAIAVDGNGNVYLTGSSDSRWGSPRRAFKGVGDAFVAKFDTSGNLVWNTFLGGTRTDYGYGIAVDATGNTYITGYSLATWETPRRAYTDGYDAFVAKLDTNGYLLWNTFLGTTGDDTGSAIAVDSSGNAYVTGVSWATWETPRRAFSTGTSDAFVAKLDTNGNLLWNTFLGGSSGDSGKGIALDATGNAYVTGFSEATWGTPRRDFGGGTNDTFVAKLDTNGYLLWNTFLGGSNHDGGYAVAVDSTGNAYVAGMSSAAWGSPITAHAGGFDAFAAKLNTDGYLLWNTFVGGTGDDTGYAIALDGSGNIWMTGSSSVTWGSPRNPFAGGGYDAFVAKVLPDGTLGANTFLGGIGEDLGQAIALDGSGAIYLAGYSSLGWDANVKNSYTGGEEAFVAKLATSNVELFVSTTGGSGSIASSPSGSSCGANCFQFLEGTAITLTATPGTGYAFAGWGEACTGNGICHIIMTNDLTATATFSALPTHTITGSVSGGHGSITLSPSAGWVYKGDTATFTMTPDTGYHILSLTDNGAAVTAAAQAAGKAAGTATARRTPAAKKAVKSAVKATASAKPASAKLAAIPNPYVITNVTANHDVVVTYEADTERLTVMKTGTGSGTLSATGLACSGSTCSGTYPYGTSVVITATADAYENFLGFSGCPTHRDNTCTLNMTSDLTVTAVFGNPCTYTLSQTKEKDFTYRGGSFNVTVKGVGAKFCADPDVSVSNTTWIGAQLSSFRNTSGTVKVTIPANNTVVKRDGTVTIGRSTFAVSQAAAPCTLAISPSNDTQTAAAATDSFTVTATAGCAWTAQADSAAPWLATTSTGNGNGFVSYNLLKNDTSRQRTGKITVFFNDTPKVKKVFTVKQSVCALAISPTKDKFTTEGGSDSFTVTATATCPWTAEVDSKSTSWLSTTTGAGSVTYNVQANNDKKPRTGRITVHLNDIPTVKKVFTVTQTK